MAAEGNSGAIGEAIASRALSQIGVPFRLHGRIPGQALDCVGLAGFAVLGHCGLAGLPTRYGLRGAFLEWLGPELKQREMKFCELDEKPQVGDLIVFSIAPRQAHLGVWAAGGCVHAHAGLRRVVLTPAPVPWQVIGRWRFEGG
ncbi:MAG: peptidoglycan endopeptidase [Sphingorhabdus sp.]